MTWFHYTSALFLATLLFAGSSCRDNGGWFHHDDDDHYVLEEDPLLEKEAKVSNIRGDAAVSPRETAKATGLDPR